eukprot:scaffold82014_cov20-Tisochrysis_lutea.AAC.1
MPFIHNLTKDWSCFIGLPEALLISMQGMLRKWRGLHILATARKERPFARTDQSQDEIQEDGQDGLPQGAGELGKEGAGRSSHKPRSNKSSRCGYELEKKVCLCVHELKQAMQHQESSVYQLYKGALITSHTAPNQAGVYELEKRQCQPLHYVREGVNKLLALKLAPCFHNF